MRRLLDFLTRFFCVDPVFSPHPARVLLAAKSPRQNYPRHGG